MGNLPWPIAINPLMAVRLTIDRIANYRIRIQGAVSQSWSDYLCDLTIDVENDSTWPVTTLSGSLQDQAALLGVLNSLYDLGFPLIGVECQFTQPKEKKD